MQIYVQGTILYSKYMAPGAPVYEIVKYIPENCRYEIRSINDGSLTTGSHEAIHGNFRTKITDILKKL